MTMCFWLTKKNISMLCKVCLMCPSSVFNEMWSDLLTQSRNNTRTLFVCVCADLGAYTHVLVLMRSDMKTTCFQASTCLLYWGIPQPIPVATYGWQTFLVAMGSMSPQATLSRMGHLFFHPKMNFWSFWNYAYSDWSCE